MSDRSPADGTKEKGTTPPKAARSFRLRADEAIGAVILVFVAVIIAITTAFDDVPTALSQGIPPEQFPRLISVIIACLAVILIIQARVREEKARKRVPLVTLLTTALLVIYVVLLDWLGTLAAMILFCFALPILWGERRYVWTAVYAILFPLGVYLLFSGVLEVRFPKGVLPALFG